eukprot:scaffold119974_cov66-Phaeocystis_antarctica.AAC.4
MPAARAMAPLTLPTLTMTGGAARRELHAGGAMRLRRSRRAARHGLLLAHAVIFGALFFP